VKKPTFEELCEREPALKSLYDRAKRYEGVTFSRSYCVDEIWYREFKPLVFSLVGWSRKGDDELLSSSEAYDVAYRTIYDALPSPCRSQCNGC